MFNKIKEYYPQYLSLHKNKYNKLFHLLGNIITLVVLFLSIWKNNLWLFLTVPFWIYPFTILGHKLFEKNNPATWSVNPLLTKVCDWMMMFQMLTGKIKLGNKKE